MQLVDEPEPIPPGIWERYLRKHFQEVAKCSQHSKLEEKAHLSLPVHLGSRTLAAGKRHKRRGRAAFKLVAKVASELLEKRQKQFSRKCIK